MTRDIRGAEYSRLKRKKRIVVSSLFAGVCIALCILLVWLSRLPSLQIREVRISVETVLREEALQEEVRMMLSGTYVWFIPKTNIFLYPQEEIERVLSKKYPRISSISVVTLDKGVLSVEIRERQAFALWCNTVPVGESISQCYFLDKDGFVFDRAPQFSGDAYFKYYGIVPYEAPIGSYYLASTTRFHELSDFVESVKLLSISPLYVSTKNQESFELFIFGGGKILFDTQEGLGKIAERLSALLKTQNLVPREGGELLIEYIDLRFGNKMFFKSRLP